MTEDTDWLDLTGAQRAIWLDAALIADSGHYRVTSLFAVPAPLSPDHARAATLAVAQAHEALRLEVDAELPRQRVGSGEPGFVFTAIDDSAVDAHLGLRATQGFAPGAGHALFRAELIATPGGSQVLLEAHHLVCDGIAMGVIRDDWVAAYEAIAAGRAPLLKPSRFVPEVLADAAFVASDAAATARAYWRDRLGDLPAGLFELPRADHVGDAPEPAGFALDAARHAALADAARAVGTTAHRALTVLAAMALARRHGRDEVVLGMAQHGRAADSLATVGQFARLLPLRIAAPGGVSVRDAVRQAAARLDADFAQQRLPLDDIVRACALAVDQRRDLVDAAISIMPFAVGGLPTLAGHPLALRRAPAREHSALSFYARELPDGGLRIDTGHDRHQVSAAETARIADRLADLLARFIDRPQTRLSALARLGRDEASRIIGFSDGPRLTLASEVPLDLFAAQVSATPAALALVDGDRRFSYADLAGHSAAFAGALAAAGVTQGDVVAVILDRSAETVIALLAILRLGAVYLPIDVAQPAERATTMLSRAKVRLVVAGPAWADALGDRFATLSADARAPAPDRCAVRPGDPAYIIFTSGSTGEPKGVIVPHRALANLDAARQLHDPIGADSRVLAAISVGFDVSMGQLLLPLLRGAAVVIAPDLRSLSPVQFWAFLDRYGVTHINSVPSFFEAMLDAAPPHARLARLMLGGEPLKPALARVLREQLNGTQVVNMYGPTEACVDASAYVVPADLAPGLAALPIGRPLPNYSFHILDARQMPVGIGQPGELCIGGAGLAIGYLDDLALTAARFVDSDYGRIYRTGDIASWREDGMVMFHGRDDGQVKIRGHRIELGEIERALLDRGDVAQAAVIARPDASGAARLLAYVVAPAGTEADPAAIKQHLATVLPHYMVPASMQILAALPLTPNGKLDSRALPDPDVVRSRAPQGDVEMAIAGHFAELLRLASVGALDSFFDLGGHSLLATQLAARISAERAINLPVRSIYDAPTVAALAHVVARTPVQSWRPIAPRADKAVPVPLAFGQEQLWILDRLGPPSVAYSIMLVFRVSGLVDRDRLAHALGQLIARHEALRTGFVDHADGPAQIIADHVATPLVLHDVRGRDAIAVRLAVAAALGRPFDLASPPLIRLDLFALGADSHVLALSVHHIVADGWSLGVMMEDLSRLYAGEDCAPLALTSADHAAWQRAVFSGAVLTDHLDWWRSSLAGASDWLDLPTDPDAAHEDGVVRTALDAGAIAALVAATGTSPFAVLMAAWGLALGGWAGQDDIILGTVLAGRRDPRLDGVVGLFANTLPLRVTLAGSVAELIRAVHTTILDVHDHQDLPLGRLVETLRPRRVAGRHPLFQALMVLQPAAIPAPRLGTALLEPVVLDQMPARFDLALSVEPADGGYIGEISFAGALFRPDTIETLGNRLNAVLVAMAAEPAAAARALPVMAGWARPWQQPVPCAPRARAAPSGSAAAHQMAALWAQVLGTGPVDVDANFFEIGGHSLAAMRLATRLEETTGLALPVSLLFDHQTPASLAEAVAKLRASAPSSGAMATLQHGTGPALVCVPGIGAGSFAFHKLAAILAPGQLVLGAELPVAIAAMDSLDQLAAHHVAQLRQVQPHGPYRLIGHSFGAWLAFAIAYQLETEGEAVAELIMLDAEIAGGGAGPDDAVLERLPEALRAPAREQIRLAAGWQPRGKVGTLTYLRADGDGRDHARETWWLQWGKAARALPSMPCGHLRMLDHPVALAQRMSAGLGIPLTLTRP
jgi:amino acid adenylation domain-containing protein